jgi:hypothetical protein
MDELVGYIKGELEAGRSRDDISKALLEVGWREEDIQKAFGIAAPDVNVPQTINYDNTSVVDNKTPRTGKGLKIATLLLLVVALLSLGGFYGYYYVYLSPQRIVEKMTTVSDSVKTLDFSGKFTYQTVGSQDSNSAIGGLWENLFSDRYTLSFEGSGDFTNEPKLRTEITLASGILPLGILELIQIDNTNFVFIKNLGSVGIITNMLDQFTNRWIEIQPADLGRETGTNDFLSEEQMKEIKNLLVESPIFENSEKLGTADIGGKKVYHIKSSINKTNLENILKKAGEYTEKTGSLNSVDLTNVEISDVEMWIGRFDYHLYKIKLDITIPTGIDNKTSATISTDMEFRNHNLPVEIQRPENYTPLMDIMRENLPNYTEDQELLDDNAEAVSLRDFWLYLSEGNNLPSVSGVEDETN